MRAGEATIALGRTMGNRRGFVTSPPHGSSSTLEEDIGRYRFSDGSKEVPGRPLNLR